MKHECDEACGIVLKAASRSPYGGVRDLERVRGTKGMNENQLLEHVRCTPGLTCQRILPAWNIKPR